MYETLCAFNSSCANFVACVMLGFSAHIVSNIMEVLQSLTKSSISLRGKFVRVTYL